MTIWQSDTCSCEIEFNDLTYKIHDIINECKDHVHNINEDFVGCDSQSYNVKINKKIKLTKNKPTQEQKKQLLEQKKKDFIK